jgi:hypothetical protein
MKSVKILFISLFLVFYSASLFAQSYMLDQKVTVKAKTESIHLLIKTIENTYDVQFAYTNFKALEQKVSIEVSEQKLGEALELFFKNTKLKFKEIDGQIVIYEQAQKPAKLVAKQNFTIHGYFSDVQSGERLINAAAYQPGDFKGTASNNFGFYSISLQGGHIELAASYMGYEPQLFAFNLKADTSINIEMRPTSDQLGEVTVYGNHVNKMNDTQMSMEEIPLQKMKKVPVIFGEADVLKVIQLLPGVQAGVEGTSGIYVRGGGPDQNLYLLDGVPVYNPSHLLGIFSVFNPEALKSVKLYKGGFPARYGGRLSSVVDISMKDGNMKELKGDFSIGLITSKFTLEGPIKTDKTSFMFSARRSYADLLAKPVLAIINKKEKSSTDMGAYFHDFNLKVNHIFSNKSRLYLSAYHGKDYGNFSDTEDNSWANLGDNYSVTHQTKTSFDISWGNTIASARWNYMLTPKLFSNTTATFSSYLFDTRFDVTSTKLADKSWATNEYNYHSGIRNFSAKIDFDYYPSTIHAIKFGGQYTHHRFAPGVTKTSLTNSTNTLDNKEMEEGSRKINVNELAAFIEDDITLLPNLSLNAGFHLCLLQVDDTTFIKPQPRISLRYRPGEKWSLKASYSRMAQHVHLLYNSGINLPTDIWVPSTKKIPPPVSDQIAFGTCIDLPKGISLSVETYYKKMNNLVEYKAGTAFMNGSFDWENKVERGQGWAYGVEFLLEKTIGKTTGWVGYTWARSERKFEFINYRKVFPSKYDRRHDISVVFTHKFSDRFDIGGSWVFGTGTTATVAFSKYPVFNEGSFSRYSYWDSQVMHYDGRNNFRFPSTHRLDLGMNFHKVKKKGIRTWSISVYNLYNQQNAFIIYWKNDYKNQYDVFFNGMNINECNKVLSKLSIMPILPTITYSYKF